MTMKTILTLLLATLCAASGYGQTIKSLGFDSTSGQVIANTGTNRLTFTNTVSISAGQVLTSSGTTNFVGIGVGATNVGLASGGAIQGHLGLVSSGKLMTVLSSVSGIFFYGPITFASDVEQTRTNLGLPLAALTNTSNVTTMRALSGSTDTNHPFSGSVSVVGTNNTNTLVFSNGILQSMQ
jgi:PPE-repeat protein